MTTRILPIPMGSGINPQNYYTKDEVNALIADFITNTVDDLTNYYLKSETYTQQEIQNLIGQITSFEVVATLPVSDIKTNVVYLLGPIGTGADKYEEYIYSNSQWVKIGETSIDLSNYVTVTQLNTALGFYTTTQQLNTLLAGKQDVLTAGDGITIGTDNVISAESNVVSLTQAQYDALVDKDPDIIYIITDATPVTLSTVATTGAYSDLTGTPTLSTVATSGSYNDLTNTPSIPTVGTGVVTLTSGGATIGTFGLNDSSNKTIDIPAGGTAVAGTNDGTNWTSITIGNDTYDIPQGGGSSSNAWYGTQAEFDALGTNVNEDTDYYISDQINYSEINGTPVLSTVATSGSYNDLTDKPVIPVMPTLATVATSGSYNDLTDKPTILGNSTVTVTLSFDDNTTATYDVVINNANNL